MAAALEAARADMADEAGRLWDLTTRLRDGLAEVPGARLHGHPSQRTPHLVCASFEGLDPEGLMEALDERGLRVDAGSVATGRVHEPSPVLAAMGSPDTVGFRFGLGRASTGVAVDALLRELPPLAERLSRVQATSVDAFGRSHGEPAGS